MQKLAKYNITSLMALFSMVLVLLVSCSSAPKQVVLGDETINQWNAAVDKTIPEPERAAKLKQLGQQLIDVSSSIQKDIEDFNQQAMVLHEKYDATHEELQRLMDEMSEKRRPKYAEYRDIIFAIRSEVSADEWKALNK